MPRYFFHIVDGGLDPDLEGTELPDAQRARCEAIVYAGQTIRDRPDIVTRDGELRVEVTSEGGMLVTTVLVRLIDALSPEAIRRRLGC